MPAATKGLQGLRMTIREKLVASRPRCIVTAGDSRVVLPRLPSSSIDCVITSPPYGNLKDYGSRSQIGFGQDTSREYLPDLKAVLKELYRIVKDGGALWLVLDTWRADGKTVPLPMEVVALATEAKFSFCDLVVWDKGKSLPWSHHGRFRGVCEYILLLGKGRLGTFDLQAARDSNDLASYWVRYPERYHPDGKAPSDLWHFPIPVQGSWGKSRQSRHFCPFPVALVARMIRLSTGLGATVLDPFAGTSSVPAVAALLGRYGFGIEINSAFVREFDKSGYDRIRSEMRSGGVMNGRGSSSLRQTIIDLRILKFARALYSSVLRSDRLNGSARQAIGAFVLDDIRKTRARNGHLDTAALAAMKMRILLRPGADARSVLEVAKQVIAVTPLTKYGLAVEVSVHPHVAWTGARFIRKLSRGTWHVYRRGQFYKHDFTISWKQLGESLAMEAKELRQKVPSIFSQLGLSLELPVPDIVERRKTESVGDGAVKTRLE